MARKKKKDNILEELETKADSIVEVAKEKIKEAKKEKLLILSYTYWLYIQHKKFFMENGIQIGRLENYLRSKGFIVNYQLAEYCHRLNGGLSGVSVELFEFAGREINEMRGYGIARTCLTMHDAVEEIIDVVGELVANKLFQSSYGVAYKLLENGIPPLLIVNTISSVMKKGYGVTEFDAIISLLRERRFWDFGRSEVWEELGNDC